MNTNFLVQVFQWGVKLIIKNVKFYYQVEYKNIKFKEKGHQSTFENQAAKFPALPPLFSYATVAACLRDCYYDAVNKPFLNYSILTFFLLSNCPLNCVRAKENDFSCYKTQESRIPVANVPIIILSTGLQLLLFKHKQFEMQNMHGLSRLQGMLRRTGSTPWEEVFLPRVHWEVRAKP